MLQTKSRATSAKGVHPAPLVPYLPAAPIQWFVALLYCSARFGACCPLRMQETKDLLHNTTFNVAVPPTRPSTRSPKPKPQHKNSVHDKKTSYHNNHNPPPPPRQEHKSSTARRLAGTTPKVPPVLGLPPRGVRHVRDMDAAVGSPRELVDDPLAGSGDFAKGAF